MPNGSTHACLSIARLFGRAGKTTIHTRPAAHHNHPMQRHQPAGTTCARQAAHKKSGHELRGNGHVQRPPQGCWERCGTIKCLRSRAEPLRSRRFITAPDSTITCMKSRCRLPSYHAIPASIQHVDRVRRGAQNGVGN